MGKGVIASDKLPAWSYSGMKTFLTCPRQFYHLKIAKDYKETFGPEVEEGNRMHKAAELYIGNGTPLPPKYRYLKPSLDKLAAYPGEIKCEFKMALTADLEPCTYFAPDVWWRGVADLAIIDHDSGTARVVDYKTGKSAKYADKDQLELMALALWRYFPDITEIRAALFFVTARAFIPATYYETSSTKLWERWKRRYDDMDTAMQSGVWNAKPNGLCSKYCPVIECPHNGRNT